jgi:uncharacterized protein YndB with AHSA1/START domain
MTTTVTRISDTELVVTRLFNASPDLVYAAWTTPELLLQWWTPRSFGITFVSCEVDARTGGSYRFVMSHASMPEPMAFHGRYIEAVPGSRLVWTNEESGDAGQITKVTFVAEGAQTRVTMTETYPTRAALDEAMVSGATSGFEESYGQLDTLLTA